LKVLGIYNSTKTNATASLNANETDDIKNMLVKYFKEKDHFTSVEIRKINTNSYLVICSTKSEANKIIAYEINNMFKLRLLNDSPAEIR